MTDFVIIDAHPVMPVVDARPWGIDHVNDRVAVRFDIAHRYGVPRLQIPSHCGEVAQEFSPIGVNSGNLNRRGPRILPHFADHGQGGGAEPRGFEGAGYGLRCEVRHRVDRSDGVDRG